MREYVVVLSNNKSLRIIAPSYQRAYIRADRWAKQQEGTITVAHVNEIMEG
jgi:hypothetical protein